MTNYDKFWQFAFRKNVSAKVRVQDIYLTQLKFKVNET